MKELVSGNPDPMLEFSDTMAQWYRCFKTARTEQRDEMRGPRSKYPADRSPYWIIHVIDCFNSLPEAGGLKRAGITLSELSEWRRVVEIYKYRFLYSFLHKFVI